MIFDIKDFYSSITKKLLHDSINFARQHVQIKRKDLRIIQHARKSLLYNKEIPWQKKNTNLFDVAMGAYNGDEVCELVGLFLLNSLANKFDKIRLAYKSSRKPNDEILLSTLNPIILQIFCNNDLYQWKLDYLTFPNILKFSMKHLNTIKISQIDLGMTTNCNTNPQIMKTKTEVNPQKITKETPSGSARFF